MDERKAERNGKGGSSFSIWRLYPLYFGLFPLLNFYEVNASGFAPSILFTPLCLTIAVCAVTWLIWRVIYRSPNEAVLMTTITMVLVFTYGHICKIFDNDWYALSLNLGFTKLGANKAGLISIVLLIAFSAYRLRNKPLLDELNRKFSLLGCILLLMPISMWLTGQAVDSRHANSISELAKEVQPPFSQDLKLTPKDDQKPSIYYIIPDGYGRADQLKRVFGYDNEPFLNELRKRGFNIAEKGRSNYGQTVLSLASSLNMGYLNVLDNKVIDLSPTAYRNMISSLVTGEHLVIKKLREIGYTYITYETSYTYNSSTVADEFHAPAFDASNNRFEQAYLNLTPLKLSGLLQGESFESHRKLIRFFFDELAKTPEDPGPKFVLAIVVSPHPPFVFNEDGSDADPGRKSFNLWDGSHFHMFREYGLNLYKRGYIRQVQYVNKQLLASIDAIMEKETIPPIIIIQADHGPGMGLDWTSPTDTDLEERMSILNAMYLPGYDETQWDHQVSPVNTFRIVFNEYFRTQIPYAENLSYFSIMDRPSEFKLVPPEAKP